MDQQQRIVVTGVGVVAPNGIGKEEFWQNCSAGISGIKRITLFDTSPYRPKEVIVYGLNLEAADKQAMEQLGVQYVDQRRSFAKLVTTVKQTALRNGLRAAE